MRRTVMGTTIFLSIATSGLFGQIVKKSGSKFYPDADFLFDQPDITVPTTFYSGEKINRYDPDAIESGGFD